MEGNSVASAARPATAAPQSLGRTRPSGSSFAFLTSSSLRPDKRDPLSARLPIDTSRLPTSRSLAHTPFFAALHPRSRVPPNARPNRAHLAPSRCDFYARFLKTHGERGGFRLPRKFCRHRPLACEINTEMSLAPRAPGVTKILPAKTAPAEKKKVPPPPLSSSRGKAR